LTFLIKIKKNRKEDLRWKMQNKEIKNVATTLSTTTLGITVTALSLECCYVECYEAGSLNKGSCLA
jgi:hypothetical protein